ncbi:MAG: hypothetical protein HY955_06675 [Deltaproteobacteria bacterium]|nr:hypothetical protein [Deltaproteobacteria bacterium]
MDDIKICPGCGAEYYAHIKICRSCDVELLTPDELKRLKSVPRAEGALVCIYEGDYDRVSVLASALDRDGVETKVLKAPKAGCGGGDFGLFVPETIARFAALKVDEAFNRMYPDLKEAEERLASGQCPACGSALIEGYGECPDCGLNLGGAGNGGCDDSGCGGGGCH